MYVEVVVDRPIVKRDRRTLVDALEDADIPYPEMAEAGDDEASAPDNPLALFYLARADAEAGDRKAAREKLERLLAQIPAQAPQRAQIEALLRTLQD